MRHLGFGFLVCALAGASIARADAPPASQDALRQVAGILEYIAGDYRAAVGDDGSVLDDAEYNEQLSLMGEADLLATKAAIPDGAPVRAELAALRAQLDQKAKPEAISERCRAARDLLVTQHGLVLGPKDVPSKSWGRKIYTEQLCNTCHGDDGSANTEIAKKLDPQPANFLDPERVAAVSPHRAFYAITYGVEGTGMAKFGHLGEMERWSLAFYVLSMRHDPARAERGKAASGLLSSMPDHSAQALAGMTDEDLIARIGLADPEVRTDVLAYFRALAPFEKPSVAAIAAKGADAYGRARQELRAGVEAHARGDIGAAKTHFVAAYLDGFEPLEASLAARDPQLVREVEREMLELREHASDPNARAEVKERVARVSALLDRASGQESDSSAAFYGAFAITLREGLEAVLLAGALLLLVRKRNAPELARYVHAGWAVAIALGFVTFFAASEVLSGMQRELAEGIAALLAAAVLLGVTHWLLGQSTAQRFMGFLAQSLDRAVRGKNAAWGVFGLSFVAVYREAFEVVLFFQALLLEAGDAPQNVWLGAALGLGVLLAVALVLRVVGQRLKPRPLMLASSVLLAFLSFSLSGKGVRALQEAAVVPMHAVGSFELPLLGIYATREGLIVQGLLLLALLASALMPWLAARKAADTQAA